MTNKIYQIAMDGPAGAGKTTVAKAVAKELDILYLDTGAMFRAMGLKALRMGISPDDEAAVSALVPDTRIDVTYENGQQHTLLDGEDVSDVIRTLEVSAAASSVGKWKAVRSMMLEQQRKIASQQSTLLDGRDIGTHVLPDAPFKFYLTATVTERARRRFLEMGEKEGLSLEEYEAQIAARDEQDMNREVAPLRRAEDAIYLDTTGMKPEEVIRRILNIVTVDEQFKGQTHVMRWLYKAARVVVPPIVHLVSPYKVIGTDIRKLKGPYLVCFNHTALWDALLAAEMLLPRKTAFMAKSSLFDKKFMRWIITAVGAVPVRRGEADTTAIKNALAVLDEGRIFAIFPEGTRNLKQDGSIAPFLSGAGLVALKAKVPVLPIYIHNGGKYRFMKPIEIYAGEPVDLSDMMGKRVNNSALEKCTGRIYEAMDELRKKAEKK